MIIRHLYLSAGHNYFSHHGRAPGENPVREVDKADCVAGRGIRGDRFFDYKEAYKGQITFFAQEVYEELRERFGVFDRGPSVFRRNVVTEGIDLGILIGREFELCGVHFRGTEECRPCYWMDTAFAPGTEALLRGRGGLRAVILTNGRICRQASPSAELAMSAIR